MTVRFGGVCLDVQEANLSNADLTESNCSSADFSQAHLEYTTLRNADVRQTYFYKA